MSQGGFFKVQGGPGQLVETITGNVGGAVGPDVTGNIDLLGVGHVTVTGNTSPNTLEISISDQLPDTFETDAGDAIPIANTLQILGDHGLNTTGATNVVTVLIDNDITLGDLTPIAAGSNALTLTSGDIGMTSGNIKLPQTTATIGSILMAGNPFLHAYQAAPNGHNTFVGEEAGNYTLTGVNNVGCGYITLDELTSGNANTAVGAAALRFIQSGGSNIAIGSGSGNNYTTESNNIVIDNAGTVADSGVIRIGSVQTETYIAGIEGVDVGNVAAVVTIDAGQLGSATITAGTNISVVPTSNTITINATPDYEFNYVSVNTSPYVVLSTDQFIGVDCSGGPITIQLPNAPSAGRYFTIKDTTGSANSNTITVTTVGGTVLIDGAASYAMNTQYSSISVLFTGSVYSIF